MTKKNENSHSIICIMSSSESHSYTRCWDVFVCFIPVFSHLYFKFITPVSCVFFSLISLEFQRDNRWFSTSGMVNTRSWLTARTRHKMISCNTEMAFYCFAPNSSNEMYSYSYRIKKLYVYTRTTNLLYLHRSHKSDLK